MPIPWTLLEFWAKIFLAFEIFLVRLFPTVVVDHRIVDEYIYLYV